MMRPLRFYGDESGAHGKGTYLIAGYLATSENWDHFKALWKRKLAEPRCVDYFKRGANYHGDKPFDGWSETERQAKLDTMISVFDNFGGAIVEISSTISWDDYKAVVVGEMATVFPNPYYFCFHGVVSSVVRWIQRAQSENPGVEAGAEFVFDQQDEHEAKSLYHYATVYNQFPSLQPMMLGCDFRDDKVTPGLQAADLIAWQIQRDIVRPSQDGDVPRPELLRLRSIYQHDGTCAKWNKDKLADFIGRLPCDMMTA
jgi:hypothetical protein